MKDNSQQQQQAKKTTIKLNPGEKFLPIVLLNQLVKTTDLPKETIEETNSELWYETLHGTGELLFQNNLLYNGPVKFGIFESGDENILCQISFPDGTKYEGTIHNNRITGTGKIYFPSGSIYEGEVLNGLRHGFGVYNSNDGNIHYEGNWKNGLKHGNGIMTKNNITYDGEWKDGDINGFGKMTWNSGNIYEGDFCKGHIQGNGFMIWYDKREKYSGQWNNDKQNGIGMQTWYEMRGEHKYLFNRYTGEWKDGKRCGYGVFLYSNGAKYEGSWVNNMKEGFGIFTYMDGKRYIGYFHLDEIVDLEKPISIEEINSRLDKMKGNNENENDDKNIKFNISKRNTNKSVSKTKKTLKNLEVIVESKEEMTKKDEEKEKEKLAQLKKKKTIKEKVKITHLNRFRPFIDLSDLEELDSTVKESENEIENIFLRNFTEIRRWYISTFKIEYETEEIKNQKEKELLIPPYNINTNKSYFCMELKDLWRFFRDVGITNIDFTFAEFDRLFYNEGNNQLKMFFIPEDITDREEIYNFLIHQVMDSKINFVNKYKTYIEYYNLDERTKSDSTQYLYNVLIQSEKIGNTNKTKNKFFNPKIFENTNYYNFLPSHSNSNNRLDFNYHNYRQVILLRHFYLALIKASMIKYSNENIPLYQKVKKIFDLCNAGKPNLKRRAGNKSMASRLESSFINKENQVLNEQLKKRNSEYALIDKFFLEHELRMKPIFYHLFEKSQHGKDSNFNDMTVSYKFFYDNIILRSEILRKLYPTKLQFIEIITHFFKEKPFYTEEDIEEKSLEVNDYIESCLDLEFVFYEFVEMMFFICRRYILRSKFDEKDTKRLFEIINHIWLLIKPKKLEHEELKGKMLYVYPKLKSHTTMENINEIRKLREERELMKKKEMERYTMERKNLEDEDLNVYHEEIENEEDDESSDY